MTTSLIWDSLLAGAFLLVLAPELFPHVPMLVFRGAGALSLVVAAFAVVMLSPHPQWQWIVLDGLAAILATAALEVFHRGWTVVRARGGLMGIVKG